MNRLVRTMGLVLAFCPCFAACAAEPPKQPDLTKHKEFALRIQKLVRENKRKELADCFDDKALFERVFRDARVPEKVRKSNEKMIAEKTLALQLANQFCETAQRDGSSYALLRVRMAEGRPRALFRLVINHNSLNYNDLVLAPDAKGALRIVDVYVALSGEFVSATIRRTTFLAIGGDAKQAEQGKEDKDLLKHAERYEHFMENARTGRYREALKEWDGLPPAWRKEKVTALMHVVSTQGLIEEDEKRYEQAIEAFRKAFPDDPAVDLISLSWFLHKKKFRTFQRGLDHIEQAYGRDPYLDVLRATGFMEEEKPDQAKQAVRRAIKDEPDLIQGHWMLVAISLQMREHKETARLLTDIEKRFQIKFKDLTTVKEYSHFVKSPEYQQWMERRK